MKHVVPYVLIFPWRDIHSETARGNCKECFCRNGTLSPPYSVSRTAREGPCRCFVRDGKVYRLAVSCSGEGFTQRPEH